MLNALLLHPAFDSFLFIEGDITTFNTFQFNGRLKKISSVLKKKKLWMTGNMLSGRNFASFVFLWSKESVLRWDFILFFLCQHRILHGFSNRNIFHLLRQMCRDCTWILNMTGQNLAVRQEHLWTCSRWTNRWSRHGTRWRSGFAKYGDSGLRLSKILKIVMR